MYYLPRIKEIRIERGLLQKEVAAKMNMKQQQYSRYESGENELKIGTLIEICEALDISADYIIGLSDTPQRLKKLHLVAARSKDNKPKEWREIDVEKIKNAPETDEDL